MRHSRKKRSFPPTRSGNTANPNPYILDTKFGLVPIASLYLSSLGYKANIDVDLTKPTIDTMYMYN